MSSDAKAWKKDRLRSVGARVVEHSGDYELAVAHGRAAAQARADCHFVDDENSLSLFAGYAAAAFHLSRQIEEAGISVGPDSPLIVYLPCGVGGAPGGIAYGLKLLYGADVHCFFAEPAASPCFLIQMAASDDRDPHPSVYDFGLDNRTLADGLAVPRASLLAYSLAGRLAAGVYTVRDEHLLLLLRQAHAAEGLRLEPSACAGLAGPGMLMYTDEGQQYLKDSGLAGHMRRATHLAWTTGGLLLPDQQFSTFLRTP
jgi:D-serine dehydratase